MTTPPPGGDLAALAAGLGIDVNNLETPPTAGGGSKKPTVFMGRGPVDYSVKMEGLEIEPAGPGGPMGLRGQPLARGLALEPDTSEHLPYDAAVNDIMNWTDAEMETFKNAMVAAGRLDEDATLREVEAAWEQCVNDAARWQSAGHDLTPWDMIGKYAGTGLDGDSRKPSVRTVVESSVGAMLDQDSARKLLNNMLSNQLGRRATDVELDNFQVALNDAQQRAPEISTRTINTDAAGNQTIDSARTGGMDPDSFAEGYAEDEHEAEYKQFQGASTYYNALIEAAGRVV